MGITSVFLLGTILVLHSSFFVSGITFPTEVSALKAVRKNLKDPENNLYNWKKTDPCTNWTGVYCIRDPSDGYLHVAELRLLNMNLTGKLAPELGQFTNLTILNFLWNNLTGSIPKSIGNLISLKYLLLSGNQLSGGLPDELGYLSNLLIFQVDDNQISGKIPTSFQNLVSLRHFHMNNNSLTGQIPPEISKLSKLIHFLVDNNKLTGYLPPELSKMASLKILQLDNNNFGGTMIPSSYGNISTLLKMSLRNCSLTGAVPDFSGASFFYYLDLSSNKLIGIIPNNKLSDNVTTIDLSKNQLTGAIPSNFTSLPRLQRLSLENNLLSGEVPSNWKNLTYDPAARLSLDFQNNLLTNTSSSLTLPPNVTLKLQGNPVCQRANELNIVEFCGLATPSGEAPGSSSNSTGACNRQQCPASFNFEYIPEFNTSCFCAAPIGIGLRLRSPTFLDFRPYVNSYMLYITSNVGLQRYQLYIPEFEWQEGPRLRLHLKIFPQVDNGTFNSSELYRIIDFIATFSIPSSDVFGPYEVIDFTLLGPYKNVVIKPHESGMSKGAVIGIVLGTIAVFLLICAIAILIFKDKQRRTKKKATNKEQFSRSPINTGNVKGFSFTELEAATSKFSDTTQIGRGGYGKVYKGILEDGKTVVAIKRAQQGSLQGPKEFYTEIELLSRLHHRNLVSLIGYCDEEDEQMLVYEFMPNGSLHDLLSARLRTRFGFTMRLRIALGSAMGIVYLHREADPPIIHRDIKPNNILMDAKFNPKVADFGISKLAAVPDDNGDRAPLSTVVRGTPGYVDPEYFMTHRLTEKSDVYSLGVVFLELLTGLQPTFNGRNIVREVSKVWKSGNMNSIIDKSMGLYKIECVKKFMELALKCCEDISEKRPSMSEVVRELEDIYASLPESDKAKDLPSQEFDTSYLGTSGLGASSVRSSNVFTTDDVTGSQLVSGVIPSIRPR